MSLVRANEVSEDFYIGSDDFVFQEIVLNFVHIPN